MLDSKRFGQRLLGATGMDVRVGLRRLRGAPTSTAVAGVLAAVGPVRRAARVDPMVTLRCE